MSLLWTSTKNWARGLNTEKVCSVVQTAAAVIAIVLAYLAFFQSDLATEIIRLKNSDIKQLDDKIEQLQVQRAQLLENTTKLNTDLSSISEERSNAASDLFDAEQEIAAVNQQLRETEKIRDNYRLQARSMAVDEFEIHVTQHLQPIHSFLSLCERFPSYFDWLTDGEKIFDLIEARNRAADSYVEFSYPDVSEIRDRDTRLEVLEDAKKTAFGLSRERRDAESAVIEFHHDWVTKCPIFSYSIERSVAEARSRMQGISSSNGDPSIQVYNYYRDRGEELVNAVINQDGDYPAINTALAIIEATEPTRFDRLLDQDRENLERLVDQFVSANHDLLGATLAPIIYRNWTIGEFVAKTNACRDKVREFESRFKTLVEEMRRQSL